MSSAPSTVLAGIEGEIRLLRESQRALQAAVAAAERGRDATRADLEAVRTRLAAKTQQALPHDEAIRNRITAAINSAFTTAQHALAARWNEIVKLLKDASHSVDSALEGAKARARA